MNNFDFNITCPDCKKNIHVNGVLKAENLPIAEVEVVPECGPKKQKKKGPLKKKSSPRKKAPKKKVPKKGKYDEDLKKLFKINTAAVPEKLELSPGEVGSSKEAIKKMEEAAKRSRKNAKKQPDPLQKIQDWLSGGANPFSEK